MTLKQKIKERDEALQNKRGGTRVVKMSNDIKKMIKILKSNYKELKEMHEKKKKGGVSNSSILSITHSQSF